MVMLLSSQNTGIPAHHCDAEEKGGKTIVQLDKCLLHTDNLV